ncbi:MAG: hybrid sensor histidine kinase/response regulator [Bacteroidota bacterium]
MKGRVLYIDDDPSLAELVRRALARMEFQVDLSLDGESGLEQVRDTAYDVVLVDYLMPGISGLEVLKKLGEQEDRPPVIMLTGGGNEAIAVKALKQGAADYLVKDIDNHFLQLLPIVITQVLKNHRLEAEKKVAEEAREQLICELDSFSHTVAHDLKSPLFSMDMAMDLLREHMGSQKNEVNGLMEELRFGVQKMTNIIDELLLLASVRKEEVTMQPVHMEPLIENALRRLEFMRVTYRPKITLHTPMPPALGYASWIEEVWTNYLSNAFKYGGKPPQISIGGLVLGNQVQYWVEDNGAGLSGAETEKLFVPFSRIEEAKVEGHGLGLSIVQRIIQKLGGQVSVKSVPGKGSTFSFTLQAQSPGLTSGAGTPVYLSQQPSI